jgi:hypothetical protein
MKLLKLSGNHDPGVLFWEPASGAAVQVDVAVPL